MNGIYYIKDLKILDNEPFRDFGSPIKISKEFGGKNGLIEAMHNLQKELYV